MAVIDTYTGDLGLTPDDKVLGSSYEGTINGVDRYVTKNYTLGSLAEFFSGFISENGSTINVTELITKIENSFGVVGDGDYSQALYDKIIEVIAEEGYASVTSLESLTATVQTNDTFARSNITRLDEVIATETFTRAQAILDLSSQFDTDLTSALATINQTLLTYADADQALAQSITDLDASFTTDLTTAVAGINQTLTTLATADQALAQSVTALDSSFTTDLTTAVAGINQTLTTLTTADQALSQSVTTLESSYEGLNTSVGSITNTLTSLSTDSLNLQSDVTILRSAFLYGAGGSIQDFDNTLRTRIQDLITAQTGLLPQDADLADVYTSLNNFNTALGFLSSGFQLDAEGRPIGILNATLEDNLTAIAQAGVTLGTLGIDLLPEQVDALRAAFDINAQGDIIGLGTTLADSVAVDVQTTLTGAGFAYAADVEQLKTSLGVFDVNGNITSLSTGLTSQVTNVVTTATGTIVSDVDALRAGFVSYDPTTGEPTGFSDALKTDIGTVIATADLASASSVSTLEASLQKIFRQDDAPATTWPVNSVWYDTNDGNKTYVLVDVSGTKTWTETSDTLKASVASVNAVQSAVNDVNGKLTASYGLTVDAGGRVAGLKLLADSSTGSNFIARADEFGVDMPNGTRVLTVNSTGLNINGSGSFTGAITATSGSFTGTVNATDGSFTGTVNATSGNFAGTLSGASINGATGNFSGTLSGASITGATGTFGDVTINSSGISGPGFTLNASGLTATSGTFSGSITGASGTFGSVTINSSGISGPGFTLNASGLTATSGTFSGDITGASGTFSGSITGASGTFGSVTINSSGISGPGFTLNGSGLTATSGTFSGSLNGADISGATGNFSGSIITGGIAIGANVEGTNDGIYIDANNKWVNAGTVRFQVGNGTNSFRISESGAIGVNVSGQGMQFYNTTGGTEGMSFSSSTIYIKAIGVGSGDPGSLNLGAGYIQGNVSTGKINIVPTSGVDISGTLYTSGSIQTAGNLAVTGAITAQGNITAYATSDERLKDNIVPISNAVDKINKIGGYEFDWNNNQEDFEGHDIGVIAQEIKEVMPEIVTERQDGYLAVRYEKIVALLIQGMKEQQIQIEELKNKLDGITR